MSKCALVHDNSNEDWTKSTTHTQARMEGKQETGFQRQVNHDAYARTKNTKARTETKIP